MCGRFALHAADLQEEIAGNYPFLLPQAFNQGQNQPEFFPRYNIAPRSFSPVVRRPANAGDAQEAEPPGTEAGRSDETAKLPVVLQNMRWGVIPHWQKKEDGELRTINARSEALIEGDSGIWASLKAKKRCVVPVNGYYEWMKKGNHRIPYYMKHKDDRIALFAGLWDSVILEGTTEPLYTFTIVTTSSNQQLAHLHDRMPVILNTQQEVETWLNPTIGWTSDVAKLLRPYESPVEFYQVPTEVGKVGTNDASYVLPVSHRKDGIEAMFRKQVSKATSATPSSSPVKSAATMASRSKQEPLSPSPGARARDSKPSVSSKDANSSAERTKPSQSASASSMKRRIEVVSKDASLRENSDGEDDSDIELIEGPSYKKQKAYKRESTPPRTKAKTSPAGTSHKKTPTSHSKASPSEPKKTPSSPAKSTKPTAQKKKPKPSGKITDFFGKP